MLQRVFVRLVIAASANGVILRGTLKTHLQNSMHVSSLVDLSSPEESYPQLSFAAAEEVVAGRTDRTLLICGTGVGIAIAANKVRDIRATTAHDLLTVRGSIESYNAQILCMGQSVITAPAAQTLVDVWLGLRHDTSSSYAHKAGEIETYERGK